MSHNTGQKKHKKALERAKKVKVKLAKRRAAHDAQVKEERRKEELERRLAKNERLAALGRQPKTSSKLDELLGKIPPNHREPNVQEIKDKLQNNFDILKALEEEHDRELKYAEEMRRMQEAQALQAQEADKDDPGVPPTQVLTEESGLKKYPFKSLDNTLANLKKKMKFGGSAECKCVPNESCQAQDQSGENAKEKVTEGA